MPKHSLQAFLLAAIIASGEAAASTPFTVDQRIATSGGYEVTLSSSTEEMTLNVQYHDSDDFRISAEPLDESDACDITATDSDDACAFTGIYAESWAQGSSRYLVILWDGVTLASLKAEDGTISWILQNDTLLGGIEIPTAAVGLELNYSISDAQTLLLRNALFDWIDAQ